MYAHRVTPWALVSVAAMILLGAIACLAGENLAPAEGFRPLFNGKNLDRWKADQESRKHWVVRDGVLAYDGKNRDLWTLQSFGDFVLKVDWRLPAPGDSGIYLRGTPKAQVNIWCSELGSGEVYGYRTDSKQPEEVRKAATPLKRADKPVGQWNTFVITLQGETLTVVLNGEVVISGARLPGVPPSGPIGLQHHGNPLEFRNILIRELPRKESTSRAAAICTSCCSLAAQPAGPIELFNGKDLTGWQLKGDPKRSKWAIGKAALDPSDPTKLQVSPGGSDLVNLATSLDLFTQQRFGDARVELDVMVPRGSNSGIYIMGEYEIQILDSYGRTRMGMGDMGAIYGAAPPRVNACKAPGQWQHFVIEYQAPRFDAQGKKTANARILRVALNGQVLHENVELKGATPGGVTGHEVAQGPLMFQGNHGPVAFRNIRITPLATGP